MESMVYSISKFVLIDFEISGVIEFALIHKSSIVILILFIIFHFISYRKRNLIETISKLNLKIWFIILFMISLSIGLFYNGNPEDFIYFRF